MPQPKAPETKPTFFKTPADFRKWLDKHHASAAELWVGFYKKDSGKPSITWPESVDEALSYGWIDGVRKGVDETSYKIRFTPRRPRSIWSAVNIKRVAELTREARMQPAGEKAFAARLENKSGIYAYEQRQTSFRSLMLKSYERTRPPRSFSSPRPRRIARWRCGGW